MPSQAQITCPHCQHVETSTMPEDACVSFFECPNCKHLLRPLVALVSLFHIGVTFVMYDQWRPDAVWFFGTGVGAG